jgi:hypothetical protein
VLLQLLRSNTKTLLVRPKPGRWSMSVKGAMRSPSLLLKDAGISSRPSVRDKSGHLWNRSQVSRLVPLPQIPTLTEIPCRSIRLFAYSAAQVSVPGTSAIAHPGFVSQANCQLPRRVRDARLDVCQSSTGCTSGTLSREWTRYGYR